MVTATIIIPVRNEADGIDALIGDLLRQTRPAQEIVIVDTGSTDDTAARVTSAARRDGRVRLLSAPDNLPGGGRNAGLAVAKGEWVAFVDGGMRVGPDWLSHLLAPADQAQPIDVVLGGLEPVVDTRAQRAAALAFVPARRSTPSGGMWRGFCLPSSAVRTSVARQIGFPADLRSGEDLIFYQRLQSVARFGWAPEAIVHWRHASTPRQVWRRFRTYAEHSFRGDLMADWFHVLRRRYLALAVLTGPALPLSASGLLLLRAIAMLRRKPEFADRTLSGRAVQVCEVAFYLGLIDAATWVAWNHWRREGRPRAGGDT